MAMIFNLEVDKADIDAIVSFFERNFDDPVPELSELGNAVLERITGAQEGLWRVIVGRFEEYEVLGERNYRDLEGQLVTTGDVLMDHVGSSTGRYGRVVVDLVNPEAAFEVGVPF